MIVLEIHSDSVVIEDNVFKVCYIRNVTDQIAQIHQLKLRQNTINMANRLGQDQFIQLNSVISAVEILRTSLQKNKLEKQNAEMMTEIVLSGAKTMQIKTEANNYLHQITNKKLTIKFESSYKCFTAVIEEFLKPFLSELKDRCIEI